MMDLALSMDEAKRKLSHPELYLSSDLADLYDFARFLGKRFDDHVIDDELSPSQFVCLILPAIEDFVKENTEEVQNGKKDVDSDQSILDWGLLMFSMPNLVEELFPEAFAQEVGDFMRIQLRGNKDAIEPALN